MQRTPRRASGFTLMELLIVIAVIGILAALLFPFVGSAQEKANRDDCLNNLKQWGQAMSEYLDSHHGVYPTFGGDVPVVQRVYYVNTKECPDNPFSLPNVTLRLRDANTGLEMDAAVSVEGTYSYRVCDPVTFYRHVTGNVKSQYTRRELQSQMDAEASTAIMTALSGTIESVRPYELPQHTETVCKIVRDALREKWVPLRGIEPYSVAIASLTVWAQDMDAFRMIQRAKVLTDPAMAAATLVAAQADAMQAAAANPSGGALGAVLLASQARPAMWGCACGADNTGKVCENCGRPRNSGS